jgi:8-oxo-dGTP pyrophosphatase MutT (NUDIX family)
MAKPPLIEKRISSGGVIFRHSTNGVEVALVLVKGRKTWCLPKGTVDRGESPEDTAIREVMEETGLSGEICEKIGQISYWYYVRRESKRIHKTVHFYLMKFKRGDTKDHDHEVIDARWFMIDDAIDKLSYKSEREILKKAKRMIEERRISDS